jgi:large subunit ribosomal protein L12
MEYIYAAMLLHSAKQPINETHVKKVLEAAGVKAEEGRVKALVAALDGVDIDAAIKEAAVPMMAAPSAAAPAHAAKAAAPKEEKKSEESAAAGLAGLFG